MGAPRVQPWMLYAGAAIVGYFLVRAAKNAIAEAGGVLSGVTDVLTGAPKPTETYDLPAIPPSVTTYYGLSCRWIEPASGGAITKHYWSSNYPASLELHNDTPREVAGLLEITVDEDGVTSDSRVVTTAGPYTFAPGERRIVLIDLKTDALLGTWARATVKLGGVLAQPDADPVWFIS